MIDDMRVVFESRNRRACADRSLVLAAANIPHRIVEDPVSCALVVPAEYSAEAANELVIVMSHHRTVDFAGSSPVSGDDLTAVLSSSDAIAVHVVDAAANQLVWEGAATGRVTDSVRRDLENALNGAIAEIFAEFP